VLYRKNPKETSQDLVDQNVAGYQRCCHCRSMCRVRQKLASRNSQ
jgi:hypothetical protein